MAEAIGLHSLHAGGMRAVRYVGEGAAAIRSNPEAIGSAGPLPPCEGGGDASATAGRASRDRLDPASEYQACP